MTDPDTEREVAKAIKNLIRDVCRGDIQQDPDGEWVYVGNPTQPLTAYQIRLLAEILDEKNAK